MSHPVRLLRTQASQLIEYGNLTTTAAKALNLRNYVTRLLGKGGKKNLNYRRLIKASLFGEKSIKKAWEIPSGAVVKLYRLGQRAGDQAPIVKVVLELPKKVEKVKK